MVTRESRDVVGSGTEDDAGLPIASSLASKSKAMVWCLSLERNAWFSHGKRRRCGGDVETTGHIAQWPPALTGRLWESRCSSSHQRLALRHSSMGRYAVYIMLTTKLIANTHSTTRNGGVRYSESITEQLQ